MIIGVFWFLVGIMHGQQNFSPRHVDFGDVLNILIGGGIPAIVGAVIEYCTRKKKV